MRRPLTSSRPERLLWTAAGTVVVVVYATLAVAPGWAQDLAERRLLDLLFVVALLLIGAGVVAEGMRLRPTGRDVGAAMGLVAVFLLVFVRIGIPAERTHLIEYAVVGLLVHAALAERVARGRPVHQQRAREHELLDREGL